MRGPALRQRVVRQSRTRRVWSLVGAVGVGAFVLCALLAALVLAAGPVTVSSTSNSKLGEQITVDAHGHTLYALRPESVRHLLCKSSECLRFWPPLTVRSSNSTLKAGSGVHGRLSILRRGHGIFQVTLGGLPLYRYSGDHAKGDANGEGIHSFGGTWHVLRAASSVSPMAPAPSTPSAPSPSPGYGY